MCLNPVTLRQANGRVMKVPCGHCSQCLKQYQDQWTARLNEELKQWKEVPQDGKSLKPVVFFTLKYRNDSIPCKYLCLSNSGWWLQSSKPDCRVLEFWTDTRRETHQSWLSRRKVMLQEYAAAYMWCASDQLRVATSEEIRTGRYEYSRTVNGVKYTKSRGGNPWFLNDLPGVVRFECHADSIVPHPVYDGDELPPCGEPSQCEPVLALEFHSVSKEDVRSWFKRSRVRFERSVGKVGRDRQNLTFQTLEGPQPYPSCSLTDTFKYFVTSEYGPKTHRPHYHGVLFGVTYEEFERYFAPDLLEKFGSVDFSVLRPSGGAMTYLSKYCSKGSYEHPYCAKDFIYPNGLEYHSKHYEHSLDDFNVDCALVAPTFHLISKGLGACYAFQNEVLEYFGVELASYLTKAGNVKYASTESLSSPAAGVAPSLPLDKLLVCRTGLSGDEDKFVSVSRSLSIVDSGNGTLIVRKYDGNDHLTGESILWAEDVANATVEALLFNQKYTRSYVATPKVPERCLPCWHKIGLNPLSQPVTKTTAISLPRYYRQWLLPPLSSCLRQAAARRLHTDVDEEIARIVQQFGLSDQACALVESLLASDTLRLQAIGSRLRERSRRDYLPRGIADLD